MMIRNWKLEIRNWKLDIGYWKLDIGNLLFRPSSQTSLVPFWHRAQSMGHGVIGNWIPIAIGMEIYFSVPRPKRPSSLFVKVE